MILYYRNHGIQCVNIKKHSEEFSRKAMYLSCSKFCIYSQPVNSKFRT